MSMRFGQGLISSLINPDYGRNLFSVGQAAGQLAAGVPQQVREAQQAERQRQQAAQRGMLSAYQTGMAPGGSDPMAVIGSLQEATGASTPDLIKMMEAGRSQAQAQQETQEKQTREQAQRAALSRYFQSRGNQQLSDLAAEGVVTPNNWKDFIDEKGEPVVLSAGANLVDTETGRTIATNPKTGGIETKDYSLTGGEVETYEAIIEDDSTIKDSLKEDKKTFLGFSVPLTGGEDANKKRILIDSAERIRQQNPKMTKQEALNAAIGMEPRPKTPPVEQWRAKLPADVSQKVDKALAAGVSEERVYNSIEVQEALNK